MTEIQNRANSNSPHRWIGLTVATLLLTVTGWAWASADAHQQEVEARTRLYIEYYDTIELTAEQEAVKEEALTAIPAPCCSDNTAYTCCCPCNMAKSWWGLSHHLIVQGANAEEVRTAVEEWFAFINPDGFSGDSC